MHRNVGVRLRLTPTYAGYDGYYGGASRHRHSGAGRNPVTTPLDGREKPNRRCREQPRFSLLDSGLRRNDELKAA